MALVDSIIGAESAGDPNASNPNSSAKGAGQFIDATWLDTLRRNRPDIQGSDADLLAMRSDPALSRQMTEAYAAQNAGILSKAGIPVTPGTTYLAHFAGPGGAVGLLNADPATPVGAILGERVVKANPFLKGMTAADVAAWADRKMGGAAASPVVAPMSFGGPQPSTPIPSAVSNKTSEAPAAASAAWLNPQQQHASPTAPDQQQPAPFALLPPRPKIDLKAAYANLMRG